MKPEDQAIPTSVPESTPAPVTQTPAPESTPTPVSTPEPVSTPVTPIPAAPTAPQIDLQGIEDKVSKSVIEKIGEALGLTKKEAEAQLPTDPKELLRLAEERGSAAAKKVLEDREKSEVERKAAEEQKLNEGAKKFQNLWSSQYTELANVGKVPKITDATNKDDQGNLMKVKILTKLKQVLDENQAKGIDYVPTLKEIVFDYPEVLQNDIPGAGTPISGGGRSTTPNNGLSYAQLHNTSEEDLIKAKYGS